MDRMQCVVKSRRLAARYGGWSYDWYLRLIAKYGV